MDLLSIIRIAQRFRSQPQALREKSPRVVLFGQAFSYREALASLVFTLALVALCCLAEHLEGGAL